MHGGNCLRCRECPFMGGDQVVVNNDVWGVFFFFSSRRRHTRCSRDWSSDVCSSDLFLGQRHDGSYEWLLGEYVKQLPPPKSGPYFSSVELSTPFLQKIEYSSRQ